MSGRTSTHLSSLAAVALNVEGGAAPEWIELIPAGEVIKGIDGRTWANPDPAAVIAASVAVNRPLPIDWEHSTQLKAPQGEEAPAAGWIDRMELRSGAIWGHVDWTPRAREQVANREYRFFSPGFLHETTPPYRILAFKHGGLTNTPNLQLTALNRAAANPENDLDLATRLRQALGLSADATDDIIVTAATTAFAANKAGPDLSKFAPRADLETALNRATTAEAALREREQREHAAAIEAALDAAQAAGKITPASRSHYLAMCKDEGGLTRFKALAEILPKIAGVDTSLARNKPGSEGGGAADALTDTELAICRQLGLTPEAYAKSRKEG